MNFLLFFIDCFQKEYNQLIVFFSLFFCNKDPGFDPLDKSPCSSELSSPLHTSFI